MSGKAFRIRNKKFHLTYRGHLDGSKWLDWMNGIFPINQYSIANETGISGYKHTHIVVIFKDTLISSDPRYFDFEGIHPNIKFITNKAQLENSLLYHTKEATPITNIPEILAKIKPSKAKSVVSSSTNGEKPRTLREVKVEEVWKHNTTEEAITQLTGEKGEFGINAINAIMTAMQLKPKNYGKEPKVSWRPWQKELLDEITKRCTDNRSIVWYYDAKGKSGKTSFARHMHMYYNGIFAATHSNAYHIATTLQDYETRGNPINTVIINFAKATEAPASTYEGIELLKDGMITSKKNRGKTMVFEPPHLVVFANFYPNIECLSLDRWDIRTIVDGENVTSTKVKPEKPINNIVTEDGYQVPGTTLRVAEPDDIITDEGGDPADNDNFSSVSSSRRTNLSEELAILAEKDPDHFIKLIKEACSPDFLKRLVKK